MPDFPKIQDAWIWPDSVERWFRSRSRGRTLHVCCGRSDVGDVTVDIDPQNKPQVLADARKLPFHDASFDSVIVDPPWNVNPYKRAHYLFPAIEAAKPNGKVLTNTTWIPYSEQIEIEDCAVRQDDSRGVISLLCESRRYPGQQTL